MNLASLADWIRWFPLYIRCQKVDLHVVDDGVIKGVPSSTNAAPGSAVPTLHFPSCLRHRSSSFRNFSLLQLHHGTGRKVTERDYECRDWPSVSIRNMAVRRTNAAIRRLDWDDVETALLRDDDDDAAPVEVCEASLDDWDRYVRSESQALKSRFMEWRDDRIWIVELPTSIHGAAVSRFNTAMTTGTGNAMGTDLRARIEAFAHQPPAGVAGERRWEPDCGYGPNDTVVGAVLPNGLNWRDFDTVKVEIGVSQRWPGLNAKAAIWRQYPGVQYIVLIRLSSALQVCQYRLEQRVNGQFPDNEDPIDIINGTVLNFDAHLLLALPDDADLPHGFQDPVTVDLFDIVEYVRPRTGPAPQNAPAPPAVQPNNFQRRVRRRRT